MRKLTRLFALMLALVPTVISLIMIVISVHLIGSTPTAITGQPMPGDPSMIASSVSGSRDESIRFFTSVTSLPDVPLPILS